MGNQNMTLVPEAARNANGQGAAVDVSQMTEIAVFLLVEAAAGSSPSLVAVVQDSPDGESWADAFSFAAVSTAPSVLRAGWQDLKMSVGRYVRLRWTISGSGANFTFSARLVPVSTC